VTPTEELLVGIWSEVLDIDQVGTGDNFFDLGGHSLLVTQAVAKARARGYELTVTDFYDSTTLADLAARATEVAVTGTPDEPGALVVIRRGDIVPAVFCVHEIGGGAGDFHELATWLEPGQQMFALQSQGLFDARPPLDTVEEMAEAYLAEVTTRQPTGPYVLAGLSMGSFVALEMAIRLRADGREVAGVFMLGAPTPTGGTSGQAVDHDIREELVDEVTAALAGPPGTTLPQALEDWFLAEWTLTEDEADRLRRGDKQMLRMIRVIEANRRASLRYQSRLGRRSRLPWRSTERYDGQVVLFFPTEADAGDNEFAIARWQESLDGNPRIELAPGTHYSMIMGAGAEVMGRALAAEIQLRSPTSGQRGEN
jgi:thioesterase domain-containing protein/aryl carrier-like protein